MLKASQKISSQEFKIKHKKIKKIKTENFNITLVYNKENKITKSAVIVSKKIIKTAVLRNKNKRIIYKILRQLYPQFFGIKYIFIFLKKDISLVDHNLLKEELLKNIK
jgi:ribonuclease P protein component